MSFNIKYIPERNLVFGGYHEEKDPRLGLKYFGPFKYATEKNTLDKVKLGIIGDKNSLEKTKEIISLIQKPQDSPSTNKWLFPPYPGVSGNGTESKFNLSIELSKNWEQIIQLSDIERIIKVINTNERIGQAVKLYITKIKNIIEEDNVPDVIIYSIPLQIEEYCGISERTRGAKIPKQTQLQKEIESMKLKNQKFLTEWDIVPVLEENENPRGYDFHNALKGELMGLNSPKPIQLLRESTADAILNYDPNKKSLRQDPASFAWNFSTALYYKANGKPWRLAKLREDTCYVGISFYKDKLSGNSAVLNNDVF